MSNRSNRSNRSKRTNMSNRSKGGGYDDYLNLVEARAETLNEHFQREAERAREREIELVINDLITKRAKTLNNHNQSDEESDRGVFSTHIEKRNGRTYVIKKDNEGNIISREMIVGIISDEDTSTQNEAPYNSSTKRRVLTRNGTKIFRDY